ncbi:hypothetical protein [Lewinella sp. W8]|uniref:hypothetical protein n=1 Tax=Lewinella sp. W8 TaxID=2528208 RepID=UPI001067E7E4|nr:hypothetical protein [Lewinella sp. W8]MTB53024.1 hypothetical protein [Lewinella sp. W8]
MNDLLDYDEYYNDNEQRAYDHGEEVGLRKGFIAGSIFQAVIVSAIWCIVIAFLLSGCAPQKEIVYTDLNHNGFRAKWSFTRKVLRAHDVTPGEEVSPEMLSLLIVESLKKK